MKKLIYSLIILSVTLFILHVIPSTSKNLRLLVATKIGNKYSVVASNTSVGDIYLLKSIVISGDTLNEYYANDNYILTGELRIPFANIKEYLYKLMEDEEGFEKHISRWRSDQDSLVIVNHIQADNDFEKAYIIHPQTNKIFYIYGKPLTNDDYFKICSLLHHGKVMDYKEF